MHAYNLPEPCRAAAASHGIKPCSCRILPLMGYGSGREDIARVSQYVQLYSIFSMLNTFDCATVIKILNIRFTYNSFTVACSSLLVLAAEEQPVSLLLELLCGGTLFRAASHLLHRLRGARLALLPYPVPRLFGWLIDRLKKCPVPPGLNKPDQGHRSFTQVSINAVHSLQCSRKLDAAPETIARKISLNR